MRFALIWFCLLAATALAQTTAKRPPIVRSLRYENFHRVSVHEIIERFDARGVRLSVERAYDPKDVARATTALRQLLEERGQPGARVKATVHPIPPRGRAVEVVFTAMNE